MILLIRIYHKWFINVGVLLKIYIYILYCNRKYNIHTITLIVVSIYSKQRLYNLKYINYI